MDKKLGKNLIMSMGYNILTIIVPFITAPYLARVLGAGEIGAYTYVQSVASYFVMFGILGMRTYGNRTIARVRNDKQKRSEVFWEIFILQFTTGICMFGLYIVYIYIFDINHKNMALLVAMYVMTSFTSIDWFCEGMEMFTNIAIRTLSIKLINLICIFLFVRTKEDILIYCLIMSLGYLLSAVALWPTVFKQVMFVKPKLKNILCHLKPNLLLFVPTVSASVYQTMDKIMIGSLASKEELAYYEYADKIVQIPTLLFVAMGAVMLSRMSNIFHNDSNKAKDIIGYSMDLSFFIGTSCGFGLAAVSSELVFLYYGVGFSSSAPILMALTPMAVIYGWANVLRMQYIIPNNKDSVYIIATFAGAVLNLLCNLVFIPRFQAYGAVIGTLGAQIAVAAVFTLYIKTKLPLKQYFFRNVPLFFIGSIMFGCIKIIQQFHEETIGGLIIDIIVGGIIYLILYVILGKNTKQGLPCYLINLATKNIR